MGILKRNIQAKKNAGNIAKGTFRLKKNNGNIAKINNLIIGAPP